MAFWATAGTQFLTMRLGRRRRTTAQHTGMQVYAGLGRSLASAFYSQPSHPDVLCCERMGHMPFGRPLQKEWWTRQP